MTNALYLSNVQCFLYTKENEKKVAIMVLKHERVFSSNDDILINIMFYASK